MYRFEDLIMKSHLGLKILRFAFGQGCTMLHSIMGFEVVSSPKWGNIRRRKDLKMGFFSFSNATFDNKLKF